MNQKTQEKVPWYSYLALTLTILFLSGFLGKAPEPFKAFDFTNALGDFGTLGTLTDGSGKLASNFKGIGGTGAKEAILLALSIAPAIIMAFGVVDVCNEFKGLSAAQKLFNPILRPLLNLPGSTAIALVTSLTSSDAGAAITKSLKDDNYINEDELFIFTAFQFSSPTLVLNFFAIGAASLSIYIGGYTNIAFLVIFFFKFFGATLCRIYIAFLKKKQKGVN
ncbi:MAG: nucleoside recognition domain-containing protein [Lachnospiraceae bacterium]